MIMIQMSGGLGNQIFIYALYRALEYAGKTVSIDDFTHYVDIGRNDLCIEKVFPIYYRKGSRKEYIRLTDSSMAFFQRVRRKLIGRKEVLYKEKDAICFDGEVFLQENAYLEGYWQSQKYFRNVADQLRKELLFDWTHFPVVAKAFREQMNACNSVSVHIRRGDYLNSKFAPIYGDICTDVYYQAAMDELRKRLGNCRFYLFTNDREWGKSMEKEDLVLVDCADAEHAHVDMALMSCCKHNIIANSSFSWWGAWLNSNHEKVVVSPARWLNISDAQDIFYDLCNVRIDEKGVVKVKMDV